MKKTIDEHAARFDSIAGEYDDSQNETEEYRACVSLVVEHAAPTPEDVVLDLGCGTGAIGLSLADSAKRVLGRDVSEGMMDQAREKAREAGIENVEFEYGTFREPNVGSAETARVDARDARVDIVVSNFAMHHLADAEKREAIHAIAALNPRRFVLGDVMLFGDSDAENPLYSPEVDDPATVGLLADALTDAGFALTAVEMVHEQFGVLVAERSPNGGRDVPE
ncbi:class I SAM-dependent methyltransferase [Halomarina oriensis]|uniref:Methyltransferase domain-containing protein n=1 Tax=Halomarina oriensis TaxID=671145 RepID=A0A6B0GME8_9EURY|nr:class I SAM-dependent methyltransferase [Halomarina oriensis]MWG33913.1 methyltransferase domain-containing protein [Halomarina oriensis]